MTAERSNPQGEPTTDPIQAARTELNKTLVGREYNGALLLTRTLAFQNALLQGSGLKPELVFAELKNVAGQAVDRAEAFEDPDTTATLRILHQGYELTSQVLSQSTQAAAAEATQTENLPPMTDPKGGLYLQEGNRSQPAPKAQSTRTAQPAESAADSGQQTAAIEPPEATFGSFLKAQRLQAQYPQSRLAAQAEVSSAAVISNWERGVILPRSSDVVYKIAHTLGLNEQDTQALVDLYDKQRAGKQPSSSANP